MADQMIINDVGFIYGDAADDTLTFVGVGEPSAGFIHAGSGNETLIGSGDYVTFFAGSGHDTIFGEAHRNVVFDGTGNSTFVVTGSADAFTDIQGFHHGDKIEVPHGTHIKNHHGFADLVYHGQAIGEVASPHIHLNHDDLIFA